MLTIGILEVDAAINRLVDTSLKFAPDFSLKDINGKTVKLSDYKGKTLIIDFWATWCGPCRASFPAMKIVIDKYKSDPNVQFLFIDTRETDVNYQKIVKKFLADNHYSFHVVFDEKGDDGKMNAIFKKYVMPGIPTKYFIDKEGIIRDKMVGLVQDETTGDMVADIEYRIEHTKSRN